MAWLDSGPNENLSGQKEAAAEKPPAGLTPDVWKLRLFLRGQEDVMGVQSNWIGGVLLIQGRLVLLRTAMRHSRLDAYIITGLDPHVSEFPPKRWQSREWISGFTGSAGLLVITKKGAGLWTDFRYWIQAERQLAYSGIELFRVGREGVPKIHDWIFRELRYGGRVGIDGRTVTLRMMGEWREAFKASSIDIVTKVDLLEEIWKDRPPLPDFGVYELDLDVAGETRLSRLNRLEAALRNVGADTWIGLTLDSIAWLLNIRGEDIRYVPVVLGYLIFSQQGVVWYTNKRRLSVSLVNSLTRNGVEIAPYEDFFPTLKRLRRGSRILLDDRYTTQAVQDWLAPELVHKFGRDPVIMMKSRKNEVEIARIRRAMIKDGIALIRFMMELENALHRSRKLTELAVRTMIDAKRADLEGFCGNSFTPIVAYGANTALVHYGGESDEELELDSRLLLVDSGAQWEEGTTDVTRTLVPGEPKQEQIWDYTLVLKGHIAVSRAQFPRGTCGYQVDALGRAALWAEGMDCGHGLGHGVGYRLGVHEGPQRLSSEPVDVPLEPGMIVSNEPGIYREGLWGVRIENLLLCRELSDGDFGVFLGFETLTLAPYELKLVNPGMLDDEEIAWIDNYHRRVRDCLRPFLSVEEKGWLESKTPAIDS